jgi:late competence protein required for DNA uptake (superfamily II DNA/RNA helicase)
MSKNQQESSLERRKPTGYTKESLEDRKPSELIQIILSLQEQKKLANWLCYGTQNRFAHVLEAIRKYTDSNDLDYLKIAVENIVYTNGKYLFNCPKCDCSFETIETGTVVISPCGCLYCPSCYKEIQSPAAKCLTCHQYISKPPK